MKVIKSVQTLTTFEQESAANAEWRFEVYQSLRELNALRPAWESLLSEYPLATTFCTWEWLSCWWQSFGTGRQLLVFAMFEGKVLAGLAALAISEEQVWHGRLRVLRLMGDGSNDSDNLDMPVRPGYEKDFADSLLQFLKKRPRAWDVCLLNTMPRSSLVGSVLGELLKTGNWTFFASSSKCSAVPLPQSWELFSQQLSCEDSKNLIRYKRRLQSRYSVRIRRCAHPSQLSDCLDALFRLHQARWEQAGQNGSFASMPRQDFYRSLSRTLLDRDWLEFWTLELDGQIAAAQFLFRYGDRVFQLQEGYDHTRSSDRPGFILRGDVIKTLISEGVRTYDLLGGTDPYKARWGAREGTYSHLHFAPDLGRGALWLQWVDKYDKAKEFLRRTSPPLVWKALHGVNVRVKERASAGRVGESP